MSYCADLPADSTIRRILIVKWSAMGDLIIATALFEDIVRAFPDREIHLDTQPAWQPLFAHDRRFQKVLTVDWRDRRRRLYQMGTWLRQVWAGNYDLVIDLQCNDRSRLLLSLLWLGGGGLRFRLRQPRQVSLQHRSRRTTPTGSYLHPRTRRAASGRHPNDDAAPRPTHSRAQPRPRPGVAGTAWAPGEPLRGLSARLQSSGPSEALGRRPLCGAGQPPSSGGAGAHRVDRRSGRTRRVPEYRPAMRLMAGRSVRANRNS